MTINRKKPYGSAGPGALLSVFVTLGIALVLLTAALLAWAGAEKARWPEESGQIQAAGKLLADTGGAPQGYIRAAVSSPGSKRLKFRVTKDGTTFTYDLDNQGAYEVFPLQQGSGSYELSLYEQVSGKQYSQAGTIWINAELEDRNVCFLYPNQYVNYDQTSEAVAVAEALSSGKTDAEIYEAVCDYMSKNFVYDFVKAATIKAGQMPDIEGSWEKKMGVCQDLSAIMCCMLRSQGIPARLMIGYADSQYHAWVQTRYDGEEHLFDPTAAVNGIGKVKDYSVERYY